MTSTKMLSHDDLVRRMLANQNVEAEYEKLRAEFLLLDIQLQKNSQRPSQHKRA